MNILLVVGVLFVVFQCVKILICKKNNTYFFVYSSVFQTVQSYVTTTKKRQVNPRVINNCLLCTFLVTTSVPPPWQPLIWYQC